MNIVVCIKQVPDSTQVKVDPKTGTLIRTGVPSILNPYDHFALETALALKKKHGGLVTVISMGPSQAEEVVRLSLALGADKGILLSDKAFAGSDTWATSYSLAMGIKKLSKTDLIICGVMAIDGDTAQTGPGIAHQLHIPQITFCKDILVNANKLKANRLIEGGYELVETTLPALCTMALPTDYEPVYPAFINISKAAEKPFEIWGAEDISANPDYIGLEGSPTQVDRVFAPPKRPPGKILRGTTSELVAKLVEILKEENFIK
jgi:electron transfer flavoprotein beta subunit